MNTPDEAILESLIALDNEAQTRAHWRRVQQWILDSASESDQVLRNAEKSVLLYRAQGANGALTSFARYAASARDMLVKIRTKKALSGNP